MRSRQRSVQRPVWSEGMLLSPQHLQAWDRHQESLVSVRVGALAPCDWGVLELEIDAAALAAGLVRFAGIMPDGLPVAFEGGEAGAPPARAIGEWFSATARSLDVQWGAGGRANAGASSRRCATWVAKR